MQLGRNSVHIHISIYIKSLSRPHQGIDVKIKGAKVDSCSHESGQMTCTTLTGLPKPDHLE